MIFPDWWLKLLVEYNGLKPRRREEVAAKAPPLPSKA